MNVLMPLQVTPIEFTYNLIKTRILRLFGVIVQAQNIVFVRILFLESVVHAIEK